MGKESRLASSRLIIPIGDCQPRLPASRLQVRKRSPNKGRWFFTCQKAKETSCDFFHWDLSAASGETKSNLLAQPVEWTANHTVPLDKWKVEGHTGASNERMKDFKREEEGGFSKWPLAVKDEVSALDTFRRSTSACKHLRRIFSGPFL